VKWQQNATTGQLIAGDGTAGNLSSQFNQPAGLYLDQINQILYVADSANRRIQKFSLNSTMFPLNGTTVIGNTSQLTYPLAVYFDTINQYLYVLDVYTSSILLFTSNSNQGIVVAGGNGNGSLLSQLNNPFDLFIDQNSSTIYVADTSNYRVVKWLKNATIGVLVAGGYGPGTNASQFSNPTGVIVDQNGTIYIADQLNSRVQQWPINATQAGTIAGSSNGTYGSTSSLLNGVYHFQFDVNMNLYVVDSGNNRIQKFNVNNSSC
ncbi:unnamed protein product, partial [Didymodactylos carnosus]